MTSTPVKFSKMHGLGNDFMVVNAISTKFTPDENTIVELANRHTGVGFDQLLVIEPSENADYFCRIYNSDGTEAEQCGNGLRCIGRYLHEHDLHANKNMQIETISGIFDIKINNLNSITVVIPTSDSTHGEVELTADNHTINLNTLILGNPHAILKTASVNTAPVAELGPFISAHPTFRCGTNVGFMEIVNRNHIQLRTFERGAGETHACGSNACAAAIVGIQQGWLDNKVTVSFRLGDLIIEWRGKNEPVYLTGPAVNIYEGVIK
jgi:diaminopimelate epimerase